MFKKRQKNRGVWLPGAFLLLAFFGIGLEFPVGAEDKNRAAIRSQVTFLYYRDLDEAARFYEQALGLKATFELQWVKIFQVTESSSVGLVDIRQGHFKAVQTEGVMLSLVTEDVDAWHALLKSRQAKLLSAPKDSRQTGTRSFLFQDPGGYTLEFFQWLER